MTKYIIIAVFVLIVLGAIYFEKRRGDDMAAVAGRLGLSFKPGQHPLPGELNQAGFDLFTQGPPNIKNRMLGDRNGREVTLFDFHYDAASSGEGQQGVPVIDDRNSVERRGQTVIWFRSESVLPDFDLSPGNTHKRSVGQRFGLTRVTFDGQEAFNRQFVLLARDAEKIRGIFTDRVLDYLSDRPDTVLESRGRDTLFYRFGKLSSSKAVPDFLKEAEGLLDLLQQP